MIWFAWRQQRFQFVAATGLLTVYTALAFAARVDVEFATITQLFAGYLTVAVCMFWGAPLIARDFETGTHRLAWTQSVPRGRWLAGKLGVAAAGTLAAAGLLTALVTWVLPAGASDPGSWYHYESHGVVPLARVLFALTLGAALGALTRHTHIAMAVSVPLTGFVQLGGARSLREQVDLDYWALQCAEAGVYLAVAVALTAVTYLVVRRRS
ncbi:ABC transporter permease subunit [Solwaraspora sp. WMMB335]|uniref:ABC transporter permease subunit n=1 Tax=Solwaraspora sp. WMMB335 TaxID=3404118 RepID=UPI003B95F030